MGESHDVKGAPHRDRRRHLQGALLGVLESLGGGQGDIALEPAQHDEQLTGRQALVGPGDVEVRPDGDKRISRVELGEGRSEEHTSELQSLMRIPYAVFCLKKKTTATK